MRTTFYIVRHGQSTGNIDNIIQGHLDHPLSEFGGKQARKRAKSFSHMKFDLAFSSDLLRARQTAEIIVLEHKLVVSTTHVLRERYYGKFQGLSFSSLPAPIKKLFDRWQSLSSREWLTHRIDETVETGEEMLDRFMRFIRELAAVNSAKNILIVCHGDLIRTLLVHLQWGEAKDLSCRAIKNTAYIVLQSNGVDFVVKETQGIDKKSKDAK